MLDIKMLGFSDEDNAPDRTKKIDRSPSVIDRRLKDLGQLYALGMSIRNARRRGKLADFPGLKKHNPE